MQAQHSSVLPSRPSSTRNNLAKSVTLTQLVLVLQEVKQRAVVDILTMNQHIHAHRQLAHLSCQYTDSTIAILRTQQMQNLRGEDFHQMQTLTGCMYNEHSISNNMGKIQYN